MRVLAISGASAAFGALSIGAVSASTALFDDPKDLARATTRLVNDEPLAAFDSEVLRKHLARRLSALEALAAEDRQDIEDLVVAFLTRRFANGGEAYALGQFAAGAALPSDDAVDEIAPERMWRAQGQSGSFTDGDRGSTIVRVFEAIDEMGDGVNRATGVVDGAECIAAAASTWDAPPALATELSVLYWHGRSCIGGRRWFGPDVTTPPDALTVTVGVFLAFGDGSRAPVHLRLVCDDDGHWVVRGLNRQHIGSPMTVIDW